MNAIIRQTIKFFTAIALIAMPTLWAQPVHAEGSMTMEQLKQQLDALSSEVTELRSAAGETWLNEKRTEEVRALVKEVLADADTRASLLENAMTAGYNNGFFLASEDGNFKLRVLGMIEFLYDTSIRNDSSGDDGEHGFEIPAVRFGFKGHIIDPSWKFFIWTGQGSSGSYLPLDTIITKQFNSNWSATVGTTKVPLVREYLVSETRITFPDRTPLSNVFAGSYTEGIWINYKNDNFKGVLSLNDGLNQRYTSSTESETEGMGVTARGELILAGNWKQAGDIEAWLGEDPFAMIGGAAHFEQGEYGDTTDEAEIFSWTVDANVKFNGISIAAAFLGKHTSDTAVEIDQFGFLLQGGVFVTQDFQLIGRYAWGDSDTTGEKDMQIASIGFNKFFKGHALKFTGELGYAFNPIASTWAKAGWQEDAPDQDGQILARAELHLLF